MSIVEPDGPPSSSLDASETGEGTKCPRVGGDGVKTVGHFVLSSVSLASRDQDGSTSDSTINNDLTEKIGDCEQSTFVDVFCFCFFRLIYSRYFES